MPLVAAALAVSCTLALVAAEGDVDQTFGTLGQVKTHFYSGFDAASAVAVQGDGKIVAAGFADDANFIPRLAVARYDDSGTLDPAFGSGGKVTIDFGIASSARVDLAIDAAGRIVVVGTVTRDPSLPTDVGIARLTPGGAPDATFGVSGTVTTDIAGFTDEGNSVAIQSDGKIVVGGTARSSSASFGAADFAVIRYNPDGSLDTSFDADGKATTDFFGFDDHGNGVAIQDDGRIVVAGTAKPANDTSDFGVVRYDPNGALDTTFDGDGLAVTDIAVDWDEGNAVAVQPGDGHIVVVGGAIVPNAVGWFHDFALVRYDTNGNLDPGFGAGGKVITDFSGGNDMGTDVVIAGDGRIIAAGWVADPEDVELLIDFGVVRYESTGTLDATFGAAGTVITDLGHIDYGQGVALQGECQIVVAGWSWPAETGDGAFGLVRYAGGNCGSQTPSTCPRTQGYWQANPDAWPVTSLTVGSQTYTQEQLHALLASPTRGDASIVLAQQMIAALLNIANGVDPAPIADTLAHADALLSSFSGKLAYGVKTSSVIGQAMVADAALLDQFNKSAASGCVSD
jgi:uncharacterized delta-60 repeat protein